MKNKGGMYALKQDNTVIERFESLPSTSDYAKEKRGDNKNLIVIAKSQTGGRGTKGRSFSSAVGGLYLTRLSFYDSFPTKDAFRIMQTVAVSVCETLAVYGVKSQIKWPNDILVNGKKICGILIENTFAGAYVRSSVVGVGLNINNALEEELQSLATTLFLETGKTVAVEEVEKTLLAKWDEKDIWKKYPQYVGFIGEEVTLLCADDTILATVVGVDEYGNLVAKTKTGVRTFSSAEVSLRSGR